MTRPSPKQVATLIVLLAGGILLLRSLGPKGADPQRDVISESRPAKAPAADFAPAKASLSTRAAARPLSARHSGAAEIEVPKDSAMFRQMAVLAARKREHLKAQGGHPDKVVPFLSGIASQVNEALARGSNPETLSKPGLVRVDREGFVQVYVATKSDPAFALDKLQSAGLRIEVSNTEALMVQGRVHASNLKALAAIDEVKTVTLPDYARHKSGSVTTQGDTLLKANLVRSLGSPGPYTGAGIKVCIISDACSNRAAAITSGNLPAAGITMHPTLLDPGDEGTAMAEIVYDLAPGVQLYGVGPATSLEMIQGIQWAVSQGCQVICDDLGFLHDPYFADGPLALAATAAVNNNGCVFVSAAGNDADDHYQGTYSPVAGGTYHDFQLGAGEDSGLDIVVPAGGTAVIYLQWNDAFGQSSNDYDLFLGDPTTATIVDSSELTQSGSQNPFEFIGWTNTGATDKTMQILIDKYAGNTSTLEVFVAGDAYVIDNDWVPGDSVVGHSAATGVISVGAINQSNPGLTSIETYSSRGNSTISFPSAQSRPTPTITAVDGVTVSGAGGFASPFYGTSAAAPHIAGVCALMLSKNPNALVSQITTALTTSAVDKGTAGFDTSFGYGLADALAAVNALAAPTAGPEIALQQSNGSNIADSGAISFGSVNPGSTSTQSFTVRNLGTTDLTGLVITKDGTNSGDFTASALSVSSLAPGASTTFTVTFAPGATGSRTAAIHIANNDSNEAPFDISLSGTGIGWSANDTTTGMPTWNRPVENGANAPATLSSFATAVRYDAVSFTVGTTGTYTVRSITGSWDNMAFLYSGSFNAALPLTNVLRGNDEFPTTGLSGFTMTLNAGVTYYLVTTGYENTDFGAYTWEVSGPGAVTPGATPEIVVEQPSGTNLLNGLNTLGFGSVNLGSASTAKTVTIRNSGTANLSGLVLTKGGANASDFTLGSLGATLLAPGASTTFSVTCSPSALGARAAVVHIASNDPDESPFDISMTGTGVAPEIVVEQPVGTDVADGGSKGFGSVSVGSNSSLVFTIKNTGTADLTGLTITKDGADSAMFTVTANPVAPVTGPSGSTTFTVRFAPTSAGAKTAAIHIANNDADENPFDITLTGTGTAPEIVVEQPVATDVADAGTKSFGNVLVGGNTSLTFTIKNIGNADLTGLAITKDGTDAAMFTVTANPVAPVTGPNGSTTFTVQFAPTSTGAKTAAIHIANNDADENPFDINLTGTGTAPEIVVEQPVATDVPDGGGKSFGSVVVGSNTSLVFTIKNIGSADLTGLTITKDGTDAAMFSVTANPVAPVTGPSGSTTFTVRFAPTTVGAKIAAIHIASNDADENPFDINLSGTGTAPEIVVEQPVATNVLDGGSKSFGSVVVGSNTSLVFTIKNIGNADLTGLTITKDGTDSAIFTVTSSPVAPVTGPSGTTTFTVQFAPTSTGAKTAAIHIASNDADENPFDITLTGTGLTASEGWRQTWFNDPTNSGNGADLNDFDHDGDSNLMEFATATNPTAANPRAVQLSQNGANLTFTYTRNKAAVSDGIVFVVEWNDTLAAGGWSSLGVSESFIDQGSTQLVTATVPAGAGGHRFVHLKVTRP